MADAEVNLSFDDLVNVLGYLSPKDLVRVSRVCKLWNEVADVGSLWKRHCLQRWSFCNLNKIEPGARTWQRYYQARYKVDTGTTTGRPGLDYACKTLRGHSSKVTDVIYVTSNMIYDEGILNKETRPLIASGAYDGSIHLWDPIDGKVIWKGQHDARITCIKLIKPNELFASGDADGNMTLWDVATGSSTKLPEPMNSHITALECGKGFTTKGVENKDQQLLFVASSSGQIKIWDIRDSTKSIYTLECPLDNVESVIRIGSHQLAVSGKGSMFNIEADVRVYDARKLMPESYRSPELFTLHNANDVGITCSCSIPGRQNLLAVGYSDGSIKLWDITNGQDLHTFHAHAGLVTALSAVGTQIISAGSDLRLCLWDVSNQKLVESYSDHKGEITSIYADASKVMTCSRDYSIRVYAWVDSENPNGQCTRKLESRYTLLGGSLQRAGSGFEKVIGDYASCVGMANDVLKAYSFQV